jgi:hypothetical protein
VLNGAWKSHRSGRDPSRAMHRRDPVVVTTH